MRIRIKEAADFFRVMEKILKNKDTDYMNIRPSEMQALRHLLQLLNIKAFGVSHEDIAAELKSLKKSGPFSTGKPKTF